MKGDDSMHDIFYFTDVHGCYDLYRAAMDACDRGEDGYRIMKELLDNPQVIYLMGNHEDMFVNAAISIKQNYKSILKEENITRYLHECFDPDSEQAYVRLALNNGGFTTLKDWMLDGMPTNIIANLINLPVTFTYENIDFCHARRNRRI